MNQNILNFRDLGGIEVEGGKVIAHRLLRGGPLSGLDTEIVDQLLSDFKLSQVLDFRTSGEINRVPNQSMTGVKNININIIGDEAFNSANPQDLIETLSPDIAHDYMVQLNYDLVHSLVSQKGYRLFFQQLLDQETGATYFHCSAGKDRTGFAAALFLKLMGAKNEDIFKDYMATNDLCQTHITSQIDALKPRMGDNAESYRPFLSVHEDFLQKSFDEIETSFGGIQEYAIEILGLNDAKIQRLRDLYIQEK